MAKKRIGDNFLQKHEDLRIFNYIRTKKRAKNGQKQAKKLPKRETFLPKKSFFLWQSHKNHSANVPPKAEKETETTLHNQGRFKFILIQKTTPRKN